MNIRPNETQHRLHESHKASWTSGNESHGVSFGFNPEAKEFVPGPSSPGPSQHAGGKESEQQPGIAKAVHRAAQDSRRKVATGGAAVGRKGNGNGPDVGGLTAAFAHGHSSQPHRQQGSNAAVAPPRSLHPSRQHFESPVLGKSPSRNFVSANHLLNFQFDRASDRRQHGHAGRVRRPAARQQPYDRNKFLQANFRFLVSDAADLQAHQSDADLMLDWSDVVEVEMLVDAPLKCPISLEVPPLCPQITPCGHVFSFPAIMGHLLTHGGDALRKTSPCPLCAAPVAARELRLVCMHVVQRPKVGNRLAFTLLKRPRRSIIAEMVKPKEESPEVRACDTSTGRQTEQGAWRSAEAASRSGAPSKVNETYEEQRYHRFAKFTTVADTHLLWADTARQLAAYAAQVMTEAGRDAAQEAPNIFAAMDALATRAASFAERRQRALQDRQAAGAEAVSPRAAATAAARSIKQITTATVRSASEGRKKDAEEHARLSQFPSLAAAASPSGQSAKAPDFEAAFSDEELLHDDYPATRADVQEGQAGRDGTALEETPSSIMRNDAGASQQAHASPAGAAEWYYFYQASDGQWLFLHPLLMRILLDNAGNYDALPATLEGPLLELEPQVQTEMLRKRHKILGHLPLGGEYALSEIDLSPLLSADALKPFAKELASRAARRAERRAKEAATEARDAAKAEALLKASAGPSAHELKAMPRPGRETAAAQNEAEQLSEALALSLAEGEGLGSSPPPPPPQSGVSFAHMAKMGFAASGPSLSASSTPPTARPSWGPGSTAASPQAFGSYPPRDGPSAWGGGSGGEAQGSLAARLAEAEASRQKEAGRVSSAGQKQVQPRPGHPTPRGRKATKQILAFGVHHQRY